MASRRTRKRCRRLAEATAQTPGYCGGWGNGAPVSPSDMLLVRQAIREGWPVPERSRRAVLGDVCEVALEGSGRHSLSAVRLVVAMEADNIRAERAAAPEHWPTGASMRDLS